MFKKYGYRIRAGSQIYSNNNPFNQTFSGAYYNNSIVDEYDTTTGGKRIPRDAPSCLVKFSNAGGNMATKKSVRSKNSNNRLSPHLYKAKNFYKKQWTID